MLKRWLLSVIAVGLFLAPGCRKDEKEKVNDESGAAAGDEAKKGSDPAKTLWAYAPDGAIFGAVAHDGSIQQALAVVDEVKRIAAQIPGGKELVEGFLRDLSDDAGFDVFSSDELAKRGIDVTKGGAIFTDNDEKIATLVIPVKDRKAFLKFVGDDAETKTIDGQEYDVMDGDDAYCQMAGDRYLCGKTKDQLEAVKKKPMGSVGKLVGELPASARGSMELVVDVSKVPEFEQEVAGIRPFFGNIKSLSVAVALEKGEASLRGHAVGEIQPAFKDAFAAVPQDKELSKFVTGPTSMTRMRLPISLLAKNLPPSMPVGGLDLMKDVVANMTGEMVYVSAGTGFFGAGLAIGMKDTAALGQALPDLCKMSSMVPGLAMKVEGNKCTGNFDVKRSLPAMGADSLGDELPDAIAVELEVQKTGVFLRFGAKAGTDDPTYIAVGEGNQRILKNRHFIAGVHTWSDPATINDPKWQALLKKGETDADPTIRVARALASHVYSVGYSFGPAKDGMMGEFRVTTHATADDASYKAYSAAAIKLATDGKVEDFKKAVVELAKKDPKGTLAAQAKINELGGPGVGGVLGITAAVAIPAFMKYIKKSKSSEARIMVKKAYDGARAHYMAGPSGGSGLAAAAPSFPKPSAGPTPPLGTCCKSGGKCAPNPEWWAKEPWTTLQFSVDDPHYYSYEYKVAPDGKSFRVIAHGDLDCDGEYSRFEMMGEITKDFADGPAGTAEIRIENEQE